MLGEDVEVVALGVERRDVALGALTSVVAVVVVGAEVRDLILAEDANETPGDRRLPGPESPTMPSITGRGIRRHLPCGNLRGFLV